MRFCPCREIRSQGQMGLQIIHGEGSHLEGTVKIEWKHNKEKKHWWTFHPMIDITGSDAEIKGQIDLCQTKEDVSPESVILHFLLQNYSEIPSIPDNVSILVPLTDEQQVRTEVWPIITDAAAQKIIIPLLKLPHHALQYFCEGLEVEQWDQIMKSIQ